MATSDQSRRAFLARIGVLGASTLLLPSCMMAPDGTGAAASELLGLGALVDLLRPVLAQLSRDTLNGFVAFSVPGRDDYSSAQGTPRAEPGGIEAGGTDFLIDNIDRFLPLPDEVVQPAAAALVTALRDLPLPIDGGLLGGILVPDVVTIRLVESAVRFILENDSATPLSLPVALLLNYVATVANPASLHGAFLSPFARLSFADKARAMEMLESSQSQLVALLDAQLPQPLKASVSGLLEFLGGALHEFAAFGSFGESQKFDRRTRTLSGRPIGWQLTGFLPDGQPGDGWDDLLGYYQDRREVSDV
jgi:hypothetical protein